MVYLVELAQPMTVGRFSNLGSALIGEDGRYYVDDGGSYPGYHLIGVAHGEWYRLITSSFLHALPGDGFFGVTHLIFNMFWLWLLGRILEKDLGHLRFLVVYLLAALGGSVMEFLVDPHAPALGASGAVYGLAACYFLVTRRLHYHPIDRARLIAAFVLWMVLSAGFTSWAGHLGGLLVGGAASIGVTLSRYRPYSQAAITAVLAALLAVLVIWQSHHLNEMLL